LVPRSVAFWAGLVFWSLVPFVCWFIVNRGVEMVFACATPAIFLCHGWRR
jgi:hypothetical protein